MFGSLEAIFGEAADLSSQTGPSNPEAIASRILLKTQKDLDQRLRDIWAQLDWDQANIAFYGETNAGKSTVIEALLLFFGFGTDRVQGATIGDGSPDFTREMTRYLCRHGGKQFALVDLPGIEGNERAVTAAIEYALARAHVVLYMTPNARPPQGGEKDREGTLEKIRRQLGPQAAVWAVYNKKINNVSEMELPLLTDDEKQSLSAGPNSLDAKMSNVLGTHYRGHIALSALPGFLSLADKLPPESRFKARRAKFLAAISAPDLTERSGLARFGITVAENAPCWDRIVQANLEKLTRPVGETADELAEQCREHLSEPLAEFSKQLRALAPQVELIGEDAARGVRRLIDELENHMIGQVRQQMLQAIDRGIASDGELKQALETALEAERRCLDELAQAKLRAIAERTQKSCAEAMTLVRSRLDGAGAFDSAAFSTSFSKAVDVDTDSGISWLGLSAAAVGLILSIEAAPVVIGLAVVGAAIQVFGSVWRYFSPDFKRQEQRKSLNRNLDDARPRLREVLRTNLEPIALGIREHVLRAMEPLHKLEAGFQSAEQAMTSVGAKLERFGSDILERKLVLP